MNQKNLEHIAIIMDGNGRWAKKRFLSKTMGHKSGANTLNKILEHSNKIGIKHLTVYAFSTENWNRSKEEVDGIMNLLREYIEEYKKNSEKNNFVVDMIGDISAFDNDLQSSISELINQTKNNTGIKFHIAINYGGRDELIRSIRKIANDIKINKISQNQIDETLISNYLDTKNIPDPELIIRTSGEYRISNFLLWQIAYSEFYFSEKLWPDFTEKDLDLAISSYKKRDRRFGGRNEE